ncbi:hypothetical protein OAO87_01460 [bacterium]|nr:hypothetical protein [bacterium]
MHVDAKAVLDGSAEAISGGARPGDGRLMTLTESDLATGDVMVVPIGVHEGEQVMLMPAADDAVYGLRASPGATGVVESAEAATRELIGTRRDGLGFTGGASKSGVQLVVVATEAERFPVAHSPKALARARAPGVLAVWCTLVAVMSGAWRGQISELAVAATSHFTTYDGSTTSLLKQEVQLRESTGLEAGRTPYMAPKRPVLDAQGGVTPRALMAWSEKSLPQLKHALHRRGLHADYYRGWADVAKPLAVSEVSAQAIDQVIAVMDDRLRTELFSAPLPVYETPWLELEPNQVWEHREGCEGFTAHTAADLIDDAGREQIKAWLAAAQVDAQCLEAKGADCDRKARPRALAIGQDRTHRCARGYVWNCRDRPCRLLDYDQPISTDWNLDYLGVKLKGYPDQRMASQSLQGVRFEADLDLISQLNPQLTSAGPGYDSLQKTVRELQGWGFYEFFENLPFWPIVVVVGQGARIKGVGSNKYRRTSDFSAPHKLVVDGEGRRAVPINEASKCYVIPEWLAHSPRAETCRWARDKYAHVPKVHLPKTPSWQHKFPKERKPTMGDVMRDAAILLRVAMLLGQPLFVFIEDASFYFNQFGYSSSELWKSNLIVNARAGDLARGGGAFKPGQLVFVSEKRLGFGSFASSNIAQRFSNAVVGWTLEEFDKLEEVARRDAADPVWDQWFSDREPLEALCREQRPKITGEALSDCRQTRLAILKMYTDDALACVVGIDRAIRLLEAWRGVTQGVNLQVDTTKRQLGGGAVWIGVCMLAAIGLVVVPKNKLLRAKDAITRTLKGTITFGEYRALVGLLEHLRYVTCLTADATSPLYHPHRRGGEGDWDGPEARVAVIATMRKALLMWLTMLAKCAHAPVTIVFVDGATERLSHATEIFSGSSDAAGDGRGTPGIGGFVHGFYWRVAIPLCLLEVLHITAWE